MVGYANNIGEIGAIKREYGAYEREVGQEQTWSIVNLTTKLFTFFVGYAAQAVERHNRLEGLATRTLTLLSRGLPHTDTALKTELVALQRAIIQTRDVVGHTEAAQCEKLVQRINDFLKIPPSTVPDIEDAPRYNNSEEALVFSVQQFCTHDGPGIRTVVFFKGCDLDCEWCHNPEGKSKKPGLEFKPERCISSEIAQKCIEACSQDAISLDTNGQMVLDRSKCNLCGKCTEISDAFKLVGDRTSIELLFQQLLKDKAYFDHSGGGITLSGGEPLLQWKAAARLLKFCKSQEIHTTIETAGFVPWRAFESVLPLVDLIYFDLKGGGDNLKKIIGRSSLKTSLDNAQNLVESKAPVQFRMVIVPGINDSEESLLGVIEFLRTLEVSELTLLKYSPGGENKIDRVGVDQPKLRIGEEQSEKAIREATRFFRKEGITVLRNDGEDEPKREPISISKRVSALRDAVRGTPYAVCLERDTLLTEYFQQQMLSGKSAFKLRAGAFAHIFRNKKTIIYPGELLVGNYTTERVGGHVYVEYHGSLGLAPVMHSIDSREVNPIKATFGEKWAFYTKLLPFWASRNVIYNSFPTTGKLLSFAMGQLKSDRYATPLVAGVSHFIPNYKKFLALGTTGMIEEIEQKKKTTDDAKKYDFYESLEVELRGLEAMAENFARRAEEMAEELRGVDEERREEILQIAEVCRHVPKYPARTFREALQAIIFGQIGLICETSQHGVGIGRIDQLLYPYYQKDIKDGRLDKGKARELLHCFSIKVSEYVSVMPPVGGKLYSGVNNGQAADFGGLDPVTGKDATNEVSYLCAEACGLGMKGPNYHARMHKGSPREFVRQVAEVLCSGSPLPAVFNDDVIVPTLEHVYPGASKEEVLDYGVVGCTEICIPGKSFPDTDNSLINIAYPLEQTLEIISSGWGLQKYPKVTFHPQNIEEVLHRYATYLDKHVGEVIENVQYLEKGLCELPTMLSTALIDGPLDSGKEVNAGGAKYNSSGIQGVGLADVSDSLYAIDQIVFKQKLCSWEELIDALRNNFQGYEFLRTKLVDLPKYGNDNEDVDAFAVKVRKLFADSLVRFTSTRGGPYIAGWYAMTTHTHFGKYVGALPSGRIAGEPLANGMSPGLGTERLGPTAALNSSAKPDLIETAGNGVVVNLKLHQLLLAGNRGVDTVAGLIRGYFAKGGMQVQFNILDPEVLIDALHHPERHKDLIVRISGYAAYFNDLSPEMKKAIIERTLHAAG